MKSTTVTVTKLFALTALSLTLAACSKPAPVAEEARPVRVTRVQASDAQAITAFAGEIKPRYEADMSFRIGGKIQARLVDLGAQVKKGQVLARLDPEDANLNAAASRATLTAAESDLEFAKAELARYEDLLAKKFVAQGVYDGKLNAYKAALAKRDSARAQASVSGNQASYTALVADADGVITAINADPGQVVAAGQVVVRMARLGEKDAVISVAENQLAAVKANPEAKINLWAQPDKLYNGKIREIAASADAATRTYTVKVALEDADEALRWGMSANVGFLGAGGAVAKPVIVVPMTALTQTDDASGAKPAVWVVGADNKVQLKNVGVGSYGERGVVITDGLKGGETVVTAGVHMLKAGQAVKPLQETPAPMQSIPVTQTASKGAALNPSLNPAALNPVQLPLPQSISAQTIGNAKVAQVNAQVAK
jgi:RND family efflux transporter MFP subunit